MNSTVTDIKPKTTERVCADKWKRVIERGTQRIEQQRKTRLKLKAKLKVQPKTSLPGISAELSPPIPEAHASKAPVFKSASISSPVAPGLSEQTLKRFDMAIRALKGTRPLSERLMIAACHLRGDPVLAAIDPRERT